MLCKFPPFVGPNFILKAPAEELLIRQFPGGEILTDAPHCD